MARLWIIAMIHKRQQLAIKFNIYFIGISIMQVMYKWQISQQSMALMTRLWVTPTIHKRQQIGIKLNICFVASQLSKW